MLDLAVVGGGPVGLVAALAARRRGLAVAVVEPRPAPIDKACGEGLMPTGLAALRRLGVDPEGLPIRGIRYRDDRGHEARAVLPTPGRGVRRTTLHAALTAAAAQAGIPVHPWAAAPAVQVADRVILRPGRGSTRAPCTPGCEADTAAGGGPDGDELHARYVIAADGLHSPQRRALGLDVPSPAWARRGLRRHYRLAPWGEDVEVHWGDPGEAYVTPVAPGLVGVAVLTARVGSFEQHLTGFPALADRLAVAEPDDRVLGAGPFARRSRARVAGRVLLVGDAAGYVDALTGEGLALGFAQAEAAVAAVAADRPSRYERAWWQVSLPANLPTAALVAVTRVPGLRRHVVTAATRAPRVFTSAVAHVSAAGS